MGGLITFAMFVIYHNKKWGWTILGATLILLLFNTFFIVLLTGTFDTPHLTIAVFSVVGLLITLFNLRESAQPEIEAEDSTKAMDYYPYIDKMEPEIKQAPQEEKKQECVYDMFIDKAVRSVSRKIRQVIQTHENDAQK
jgi:hypothetical protein